MGTINEVCKVRKTNTRHYPISDLERKTICKKINLNNTQPTLSYALIRPISNAKAFIFFTLIEYKHSCATPTSSIIYLLDRNPNYSLKMNLARVSIIAIVIITFIEWILIKTMTSNANAYQVQISLFLYA